MTFAVNHLAHFLLTLLLLDMLQTSAPSRIVTVSSTAHSGGFIDYRNLKSEGTYTGWKAYQVSKLANILFSYELADQLRGTSVTANCLHPGAVDTKMLRASFPSIRGINLEAGAATSVFLASSPQVEGVTGKYFKKKKPARSSSATYDLQERKKLWQVSIELISAYLH